jgi:hypothetical protein
VQWLSSRLSFADKWVCRWLTAKWRYWRRAKCLTQHQLQESLRGPVFELDYRYGEQQHMQVCSTHCCDCLGARVVLSLLSKRAATDTCYITAHGLQKPAQSSICSMYVIAHALCM